MSLADIQRAHVVRAIDECRAVGTPAFLDKYDFADSYDYVVEHDGDQYPAKAVLGAAHGYALPEEGPLPHTEFTGGPQTNNKLKSLGFDVVVREGATRAKAPGRSAQVPLGPILAAVLAHLRGEGTGLEPLTELVGSKGPETALQLLGIDRPTSAGTGVGMAAEVPVVRNSCRGR